MRTLALLILLTASLAGAQVPEALKTAKTACIKQLYGSAQDTAAVRSELKKWGRLKLLDDCTQADVALWIAAGSPAQANLCHVTLQAIGKDQHVLWSATRDCKGTTPPALGKLVRQLRADLEHKKK